MRIENKEQKFIVVEKFDKVTSIMAALMARDSSVRSIRNITRLLNEQLFEELGLTDLRTRAEYLESTWQNFQERNGVLIERARDDEMLEEAEQHNQLFDLIETEYLQARARIQWRINSVMDEQQRNLEEDNQSIEAPIPNGQRNVRNDNESVSSYGSRRSFFSERRDLQRNDANVHQ